MLVKYLEEAGNTTEDDLIAWYMEQVGESIHTEDQLFQQQDLGQIII